MSFQYRIGKLSTGFVSLAKVISHASSERTINWFLTGVKEPLFGTEMGRIENFSIYNTKPDGE